MRPIVVVAGVLTVAVGIVHAVPPPDEVWTRVDTEAFSLIGAAPPEETLRIASDLAVFHRDVFGDEARLGIAPPLRMVILILPEAEELHRFRLPPASLLSAHGISCVVTSVDRIDLLRPRYCLELLDALYPASPSWVRRGLLSFLCSHRSEGDTFRVGYPDPKDIRWLRMPPGVTSLEPILARAGAVALDPAFCREEWLLVHYLLLEMEDGERRLLRYLRAIERGTPAPEAFVAAFGASPAEMLGDVQAYLSSPPSRYLVFESSPGPAPEARALRHEELLVAWGELLVLVAEGAAEPLPGTPSGVRPPEVPREELLTEAKTCFARALGRNGSLASAHRGLGALEAAESRWTSAARSFGRATELDSLDALAHYRRAESLLRSMPRQVRLTVSANPTPSRIVEARSHLERCMALDPDFAEAHILFGSSYVFDPGDPGPGIDKLERMATVFPARLDVARDLYTLYLKRGDLGAAFDVLDERFAGFAAAEDLERSRRVLLERGLELCRRDYRAGNREGALETHALLLARLEGSPIPADLASELAELGDGLAGGPPEARTPDRSGVDEAAAQRRHEFNYRRFVVAWHLAADGEFAKALPILDEVLAAEENPDTLAEMQRLRERVRYRLAKDWYRDGRVREAREVAVDLAENAGQAAVRHHAGVLVMLCDRRAGS